MSTSADHQTPPGERYQVQKAGSFQLGLIFSDAFRILNDGFGTFLAVLLLINLPLLLVQSALFPNVDLFSGQMDQLGRLVIAGLLFSVLSLFVTVNVFMTSGYLAAGVQPRFGSVLVYSVAIYPSVVIASIVIFVVVAVGTMALIIPGVIAWIFARAVIPLIVVRRQPIFGSFSGSFELIRGHWFQVFIVEAMVMIGGVVIAVLASPLAIMAEAAGDSPVAQIPSNFILGAVGIVSNLISISMYFNLEAIWKAAHGVTTAAGQSEQAREPAEDDSESLG